MKQIILAIILILLSLAGFTQDKDTTFQTTLSIKEYRALISTLDANIDSKKTTSDLILFIQRHTIMLPPKQDTSKPKK